MLPLHGKFLAAGRRGALQGWPLGKEAGDATILDRATSRWFQDGPVTGQNKAHQRCSGGVIPEGLP